MWLISTGNEDRRVRGYGEEKKTKLPSLKSHYCLPGSFKVW